MTPISPGLGLDFGTSHTVAVLARDDGRVEPLLFDASPLLPSAVFAEEGGRLLVGRDADRGARVDPSRYEPNLKRRLDDGALLLGDAEVRVVDACAAVLRRVRGEAARTLGGTVPGRTVLTCPAGWGPRRRELLATAAGAAGLSGVELVSEPVAAAAYFTQILGHLVRHGGTIVVYDFGGGTFDVSVVRRTGDDAWAVVAAGGLDDVGGVDLDAAVVDWAQRTVRPDDPAWQRLRAPGTPADRRHRRHLWDDARAAKEHLSRATSAGLAVPILDVDAHLTRAEYETIARPWLDRTVRLTRDTIAASQVPADRLAGIFLVGGASRTPLVATMLHRALGLAPIAIEQPELVVAHGCLTMLPAAARPSSPAPSHRSSAPPSSPAAPRPSSPPASSRKPVPAQRAAGGSQSAGRLGERPGSLRAGRDHETHVVLSPAQAAKGGRLTLSMEWPALCPPCSGTGVAGGAGRGPRCAACAGSGLTGRLDRRSVQVRLPAGVTDGQRVRLAGGAHPSPDDGGPAGDLLVTVRVR
ncbi:Hsp70 family protein [Dactylosporangium sp. NPDC048998]|uniref:Hsp70 family protein n=1 Tax=Dactylosporangium sp. NPDC048998 TaxID=3363976 RepID=UPI003722081F